MTRSLRLVLASFASLALLGASAGCHVSVDEEGNSVTLKPATRYNGTPETETAAWSSGQAISVFNDNGNVIIRADASATEVSVTGKPFAFHSEKEKAKEIIEQKLNLKVENENGEIIVAATMGGSGSYGYDLEVHIPAGFDGALDVQQQNGNVELASVGQSKATRVNSNNGSVKATGATLTGRVELTTRLGAIEANLLPTGNEESRVRSDSGSVSVGIAEGAHLTIHAFAERGALTFPETWPVSGEENNRSFTLGEGTTKLEVSSGDGDVELR